MRTPIPRFRTNCRRSVVSYALSGVQLAGFASARTAPRAHGGDRFDQWPQRFGIVGVGGRDAHRQWDSRAIGQHVDLGEGLAAIDRARAGQSSPFSPGQTHGVSSATGSARISSAEAAASVNLTIDPESAAARVDVELPAPDVAAELLARCVGVKVPVLPCAALGQLSVLLDDVTGGKAGGKVGRLHQWRKFDAAAHIPRRCHGIRRRISRRQPTSTISPVDLRHQLIATRRRSTFGLELPEPLTITATTAEFGVPLIANDGMPQP
ncbi:hypothetical protein [Nocardia abscessus]|uniref:hypothetical protein n=1 Tax=Nocardia abscessus TaxID=120957 RepID=UPI00245907F1|nr:hypothetical protein [Nocardia abscessus]